MLPAFDLIIPGTLTEACALKLQGGRILAGGTDVLVSMHGGALQPRTLIDIKALDELKGMQETPEGLDIGALITHRELEVSPLIRQKYTALFEGCSQVGSMQIRFRGTLGGNICNAVPSADSTGPLLALGAVCIIAGSQGERSVPLSDFFTGAKHTVLKEDELLKRVLLPLPAARSGSCYTKFTRRNAMDIALYGVSCYVALRDEKIAAARIALTTAAPTPIRAYEAEKLLIGRIPDGALAAEAGKCARAEARPRSSWRSSAEFRLALTEELTARTVTTAVQRAREALP